MSTVEEFFETYREALLARDETAVAGLYAVPSLILFPGQPIAVSDAAQTERFLASSWPQYEGVDAANFAPGGRSRCSRRWSSDDRPRSPAQVRSPSPFAATCAGSRTASGR